MEVFTMKTFSLSVGIDLARRSKHMAVFAPNPLSVPHKTKKTLSFCHDVEGFEALFDNIRHILGTDDLKHVSLVMEPTGNAWCDVANYFIPKGASAFFVRTDVISALRKAQSRFAKTDRIDARTLASMPWTLPERLIPIQIGQGALRILRELSTQRFRIVQECTRWKNRLLSHLEIVWQPLLVQLPKAISLSKSMLLFWEKFPHPQDLVSYGAKRFHRWFEQHAHAGLSKKTEETILCFAAKAANLRLQVGTVVSEQGFVGLTIPHMLKMIRLLEDELTLVETWITQARKDVPECDILDEIPGVGPVVCVSLATTLMPIERFDNIKKCAAYTGFISRKKASAGHEIQGMRITKTGNRRLKRDLALAADCAMRRDPLLAAFAIRLLAAGKHYNQVRVAVGRKLATYAYSLLKRVSRGEKNVHYEYRDVRGNVISKEEARKLAETLWQKSERKAKKRKSAA